MTDWYEVSGVPGQGADGSSADMRSEFNAVQDDISAKLPILTARANRPIFVDATGTQLESKTIAAARSLLGLDGSVNSAVTTGTANAYLATIPAVTAYVDLQGYRLKIHATNTTTSTLNINGFGVKTMTRADGEPLEDGDLVANRVYDTCYNSSTDKIVVLTSTSSQTFEELSTLIVKTGLVTVAINAGNVELDLSAGTVFILIPMASNATVTLINFDPTKACTFSMIVITTGAYNFTNLTMAGITIYCDEGMLTAGGLKANGCSVVGFLFTGTTLHVITSFQNLVP